MKKTYYWSSFYILFLTNHCGITKINGLERSGFNAGGGILQSKNILNWGSNSMESRSQLDIPRFCNLDLLLIPCFEHQKNSRTMLKFGSVLNQWIMCLYLLPISWSSSSSLTVWPGLESGWDSSTFVLINFGTHMIWKAVAIFLQHIKQANLRKLSKRQLKQQLSVSWMKCKKKTFKKKVLKYPMLRF